MGKRTEDNSESVHTACRIGHARPQNKAQPTVEDGKIKTDSFSSVYTSRSPLPPHPYQYLLIEVTHHDWGASYESPDYRHRDPNERQNPSVWCTNGVFRQRWRQRYQDDGDWPHGHVWWRRWEPPRDQRVVSRQCCKWHDVAGSTH